MGSFQESQRTILAAAFHKKPDRTRQAQDGKCRDRNNKIRKKSVKPYFPPEVMNIVPSS